VSCYWPWLPARPRPPTGPARPEGGRSHVSSWQKAHRKWSSHGQTIEHLCMNTVICRYVISSITAPESVCLSVCLSVYREASWARRHSCPNPAVYLPMQPVSPAADRAKKKIPLSSSVIPSEPQTHSAPKWQLTFRQEHTSSLYTVGTCIRKTFQLPCESASIPQWKFLVGTCPLPRPGQACRPRRCTAG
jgi:hypothetical protein